jgi:hypothetical protein
VEVENYMSQDKNLINRYDTRANGVLLQFFHFKDENQAFQELKTGPRKRSDEIIFAGSSRNLPG